MKVYVVMANNNDKYEWEEWFDGVYSTKEKAQNYIEERTEEFGGVEYYRAEIVESEVE